MVRSFNKAEFHHGENTRILILVQKPTNKWSLEYIRIVNIQKVFRLVHFWGSFPIKWTKIFFFCWKNKHLHMHSSTQMSHAGIILDADPEFKVRLPRLWLFTLGIKSKSNQYLGKIRFFFPKMTGHSMISWLLRVTRKSW